MTDTRARQAAAGPDDVDLVARMRDASVTAAARGRDDLDAEVYHACMDAAAAIEARDAEIARMREALARIVALGNRVDMSGQCAIAVAIISARAALAPPPASDGGEA